jgi:hypothetical protein
MNNPLLERLHAMEELELFYMADGIQALEDVIPEYARPHWQPAFQGNVEAALFLGLSLQDFQRGILVHAFWSEGASADVVRVLLDLALTQTHFYGRIPDLFDILRFANFTIPPLPESVTVYRGGDPDGLSWTLSRKVAEWFAEGSNTEVHQRVIHRDSILFYSNDREEQEIIFDPEENP